MIRTEIFKIYKKKSMGGNIIKVQLLEKLDKLLKITIKKEKIEIYRKM